MVRALIRSARPERTMRETAYANWNQLEIEPACTPDMAHSCCRIGRAAAYVINTRPLKTLPAQIPANHKSNLVRFIDVNHNRESVTKSSLPEFPTR